MPEYQPRADYRKIREPRTRTYLQTAEWCGLEGSDEAAFELSVLPRWSAAAIAYAERTLESFYGACPEALAYDATQIAHDLWLTQNRHGAGFWDSGLYTREHAKKFTEYAHCEGSAYVTFDAHTGVLDIVEG